MHLRIIHGSWFAGLVVPERRVCLNQDALLFAELHEGRLLQIRMDFDLVDGWDDAAVGKEVVDAALVEVRDADGADFFGHQQGSRWQYRK